MAFLGIGLCCTTLLWSQDIAEIKKQKPLEWRAGLSLGSNFSTTNTNFPTTSPFGYYINANANIAIYGFKIPMSVSFRDQQLNYTKPMYRLGMSPPYKWAKFYIGHSQMLFSNYTLTAMTFKGGGIALSPGKFRFSAMVGSLESPRALLDSINGNHTYIKPYNRLGIGGKIGIGSSRNYIDLIVFNAKDRARFKEVPDSIFAKRAENTVMGIQSSVSLFKRLITLVLNTGASVYTANQNAADIEVGDREQKYYDWGSKIMTINNSTRVNFAGDASLQFNLGNYQIGAKYQYIDPLYSSLGAYYFRDDNENYTIDGGASLWQGKLSFNGSFGLQQNNVRGHRSLTSVQKIYDASINLIPNKFFGLSAQYSNFNFDQVSGIVQINDSLKYGQINSNISISPYISFGNKNIKQTISLNYSLQSILDLSLDEALGQNADVTMASINHTFQHKPNAFSIHTSLQYMTSEYATIQNGRYGMYISGTKRWLTNKLQTRLQINYNKNVLDQVADGNQYGFNTGIQWKLTHKSQLGFSLNYIDRNAVKGKSYQEWRGNTSLNYQLK